MRIASMKLANAHRGGGERSLQVAFPIPFGASSAAVEIKRRGTVLRIRVARKVRFRERDQTCDAALAGEFVPDFANRF